MGIKITVDIDDEMLNEVREKKSKNVSLPSLESNRSEEFPGNYTEIDSRLKSIERTVENLAGIVGKLSEVVSNTIVDESKIESLIDKKLEGINLPTVDNSDIDKRIESILDKKLDNLLNTIDNRLDEKIKNFEFPVIENTFNKEEFKEEIVTEIGSLVDEEIKKKESVLKESFEKITTEAQQNLMNFTNQLQMSLMNQMNMMNQMNPVGMTPQMTNAQTPLSTDEKNIKEAEKIEEKREAPSKDVRKKISAMMDI